MSEIINGKRVTEVMSDRYTARYRIEGRDDLVIEYENYPNDSDTEHQYMVVRMENGIQISGIYNCYASLQDAIDAIDDGSAINW